MSHILMKQLLRACLKNADSASGGGAGTLASLRLLYRSARDMRSRRASPSHPPRSPAAPPSLFKRALRAICCGVFLAALATLTGCNKPGLEDTTLNWKQFSPPGGRFTIKLPSEPVKQEQRNNSEYEATTYRIITALSHVAGMAVGYSDQPPTGVFEGDPVRVLDAMRDKVVSDLNGQLRDEKEITLGAFPGRELLIDVKAGMRVRQRLFLANTRVYSLMVIAGAKGLTSPEAETFFGTFQILK